MHHRPPEPPIPRPEGYPLTYLAADPSRFRRFVRKLDRRIDRGAGWIAAAAVVVIAGIGCFIVAQDSPARSAVNNATVAKPTAVPGPPVPPKATEYAPPRPGQVIPGDGQFVVGKDIEPGLYRSQSAFLCYWERLRGLSGESTDLIDNGFGGESGQVFVVVVAGDYAFSSSGCAGWERIR